MSKPPYHVSDTFCIRNPLFSFSNLKKIIEKEEVTNLDYAKILKNNVFREALYLASPNLLTQIKKWENGNLTDLKKINKLKLSIFKYYIRISTRCTPFGLFSSCSSGKFCKETAIKLKNISEYKRVTRFNTSFLNKLLHTLLEKQEVKEQVLFYPNSSLYKINDCYRYIEYKLINQKREYSIQEVDNSVYLEKIITAAKKGKYIHELTNIISDIEISVEEAKSFVFELIDNQILVSELDLTLTGEENFEWLIKRINQIKLKSTSIKLLEIKKQISILDLKIGNQINSYKEIQTLSSKVVSVNDSEVLFHTDLFSSSYSNTLNKKIKYSLLKGLKIFNKMSLGYANSNLEDFKRHFNNRYGEKKLPLNLVLDPETGIGYGKKYNSSSLLENIYLDNQKKRYERIIWRDVDTIMQQKIFNCFSDNKYSIELTEKDFEIFHENWEDLPDTFSSLIEVYKGGKIFMDYAGGTSAVNLLGRLAHGDKKLLNHIYKIAKIEEQINQDKILAEIVHLPKVSTGNILQRPKLRNFEIPYLGKSSTIKNNQILIEDILVSINNNKIKLFSKQHQKEIIPRLSNAHLYNTPDLLPAYRFLCELQAQNLRQNIGFNWNNTLIKLPFLPRVEFENIIFSKAKWNIETEKLKVILNSKNILSSIKLWQNKLLLPNYVELVENDKKLLFYLQNLTSIKALYDTIKNRKQFILEEFLFSKEELIKRENENFTNEFIVSFYNTEKLNKNEE